MSKSVIQYTLAAVVGFSAPLAMAQENSGVVRIVVGFAPGGAVDAVARALAERLRTSLNQTVIVDNKPGASQRLALSELKRSRPDGLTLILSNNSPFTLFPHAFKKLEFDPAKDFTPIGRVTTYDLCIAAGPKAPPGGVKEFLAWAKANPEEASYATSGAGNMGHFIGVMVSTATGVELNHVPYRGGAPALIDVAGGQVPIAIDTILEPLEMAKSGKIRILATTGANRTTLLPNVPTLKESGVNVTAEAFLGLYGPAGLPSDKVQRLSKALNEAMQNADLQKKMHLFAMKPAYSTPEELRRVQTVGLAGWESTVKASGFSAD